MRRVLAGPRPLQTSMDLGSGTNRRICPCTRRTLHVVMTRWLLRLNSCSYGSDLSGPLKALLHSGLHPITLHSCLGFRVNPKPKTLLCCTAVIACWCMLELL
jgi:hypothetical protein